MPLVVKGFPVLIVLAAVVGVVYFFRAYQRLGKPKKDYYILPYNILKEGVLKIIRGKGAMLFMVILFGVYLISVLFSEDKENTVQKIILKSCYLYFPLIFALTKWDKGKLIRVLDFFIYGCCLQVVISITDAFWASGFQFDVSEFTYVKLSYNLHPSYAALIITIGFIFNALRLLFIYRERKSISGNRWRILALFGFVCYIILLSSKAGILSILIAFSGLLIFSLIVLKSWKITLLTTLIASFVFFLFFFFLGGRAKERYVSMKNSVENRQGLSDKKNKRLNSSQIRLVLWENSWEAIQKSNFLGYGIGHGKNALQKNLQINNEEFVLSLSHNSHNQYFETALSIGVIGFLLLVLILICSAFGFGNFTWISMLLVFVVSVNLGVESMMEKQTGSIPIVWLLCLLTSARSIFKSVFKL
ncbi:MAG: hypothetical protein CMP63_06480 [Flavobacteriales bacterium]|nr:hypothetical protein [Flavobacteriales bacterium]|tara:strand:+ start:6168 stop:7418 length:1251 start_codon:yes stop_codon:yes gene_type:complete